MCRRDTMTTSHQRTASAAECQTMQDVRREIDRVDRNLVVLLAERLSYIARAANIKTDRDMVYDASRIEDVVKKIRAEAEKTRLAPDFAEEFWRELMRLCIAHEYAVFDGRGSP